MKDDGVLDGRISSLSVAPPLFETREELDRGFESPDRPPATADGKVAAFDLGQPNRRPFGLSIPFVVPSKITFRRVLVQVALSERGRQSCLANEGQPKGHFLEARNKPKKQGAEVPGSRAVANVEDAHSVSSF